MRYLPLVFVIGCATPDLSAEVAESMAVEAVTVCPTGQWCSETAPAPVSGALLHSVWAVSADDVFAVGDGGAILRRINDAWTVMASGTTSNLRGVWAASSSDVWASGVAGTILHFDGTAWSQVPVTTTADLDAVWGSSSSDVWFVGSGTVLRWTGAGFTSSGFGGVLLSVSGTGPNDVWATGENAGMQHWNGTAWTKSTPVAGTTTYFAVLALAASDAWVTNFLPNKEAARWNGVKWVAQRTGSGIFNGLSALAPNDVWGAGGSRVGHWNGTAWTSEQPFGSSVALWSVTAVAGHVWIVGSAGVIAHRSL